MRLPYCFGRFFTCSFSRNLKDFLTQCRASYCTFIDSDKLRRMTGCAISYQICWFFFMLGRRRVPIDAGLLEMAKHYIEIWAEYYTKWLETPGVLSWNFSERRWPFCLCTLGSHWYIFSLPALFLLLLYLGLKYFTFICIACCWLFVRLWGWIGKILITQL